MQDHKDDEGEIPVEEEVEASPPPRKDSAWSTWAVWAPATALSRRRRVSSSIEEDEDEDEGA